MPNYKKDLLTGGLFSIANSAIFPDAENTGVPAEPVPWGSVTVPNYKKDLLTGGLFSIANSAIFLSKVEEKEMKNYKRCINYCEMYFT